MTRPEHAQMTGCIGCQPLSNLREGLLPDIFASFITNDPNLANLTNVFHTNSCHSSIRIIRD